MSDSQRTKETTTTKTAKREGWAGDEELEWAEPISEEAKLWVSWHFEEKLQRDHGGRLTQEAACALTRKDKKLQRYVAAQGLKMRPSDVAWSWVAQQVMDGTVAEGEIVFRPEIGSLADVEEQVLWQWVARAVTGWEVELRRAMSRKMLARMVLSRQLLKSTYRVREKRLAAEWGMTTGEVFDMMGESTVEMTKGLSAAVWKNAHKQAGFAETGGRGSRRFWACMHMFREEGKVVDRDHGMEGRDRDLSWDGMAEVMARMVGGDVTEEQSSEEEWGDVSVVVAEAVTQLDRSPQGGAAESPTLGVQEVRGDDNTRQGGRRQEAPGWRRGSQGQKQKQQWVRG